MARSYELCIVTLQHFLFLSSCLPYESTAYKHHQYVGSIYTESKHNGHWTVWPWRLLSCTHYSLVTSLIPSFQQHSSNGPLYDKANQRLALMLNISLSSLHKPPSYTSNSAYRQSWAQFYRNGMQQPNAGSTRARFALRWCPCASCIWLLHPVPIDLCPRWSWHCATCDRGVFSSIN